MRRKSERTKEKEKPSPEKKVVEKYTRRSKRHATRRKKSESPSPEKVESEPEEAKAPEGSPDSSNVVTVEETSVSSKVEGAGKTKLKKSESEDKPEIKDSEKTKSDSEGEEWKEDKSFWEQEENKNVVHATHKEQDDSGAVWQVTSTADSGQGEIKKLRLSIVRAVEQPDSSTHEQKRVRKDSESIDAQTTEQTTDQIEECVKEDESKNVEMESEKCASSNAIEDNVEEAIASAPVSQETVETVKDQPQSDQDDADTKVTTTFDILEGISLPPGVPSLEKSPQHSDGDSLGENNEKIESNPPPEQVKESAKDESSSDEKPNKNEIGSDCVHEKEESSDIPNKLESTVADTDVNIDEKNNENEESERVLSRNSSNEDHQLKDEKLKVDEERDNINSRTIKIRRKSHNSSSSSERENKKESKEIKSESSVTSIHSTSKSVNLDRQRLRRSKSQGRSRSPVVNKKLKRSSSERSLRNSSSRSRSPPVQRERITLKRSCLIEVESFESTSTIEHAESLKQKEDKENDSAEAADGTVEKGVIRKRRWGGSKSSRTIKKPLLAISTEFLKNLVPGAKPVPLGEVQLSPEEDRMDDDFQESDKNDFDKDDGKLKERDETSDMKPSLPIPEAPRINALSADSQRTGKGAMRKISIVSDDARTLQHSPSPPRHKASSILFITNLVRPFTVNQLKELLARTGNITPDGFWIDKIKSKCYVEYQKESEAIETRHALHGVRWPVSNPKQLCVDFGKKEDMELARAVAESEPIPRKTEPLQLDHTVEGWVAEQLREKERQQERDLERERGRPKERIRGMASDSLDRNTRKVPPVVREWDLGKMDQLSPERDARHDERNKERDKKFHREKVYRSRSPTPDGTRKSKKKEEEAPSKLLDDLFKKTKTTPCIYWLPLTAEQIVVKEEMRRKHMAEHERRMAEIRKAERDRERVRSQQRHPRRLERDQEKRKRRSHSSSHKK